MSEGWNPKPNVGAPITQDGGKKKQRGGGKGMMAIGGGKGMVPNFTPLSPAPFPAKVGGGKGMMAFGGGKGMMAFGGGKGMVPNFTPLSPGPFPAKVGGAKKQQQEKKQDKKQEKKQDKQSQRQKKGGAFVDDVKNLAVPFAILLAKEGLSKVFDKTSKSSKSKSTLSASSAKKTTSSRRRTTMAGGSCNLGCQAGGAAQELVKLQDQIDNFLNKY
jgi:hypothetical protein